MIVDVSLFNAYSGNHEDAREAVALKETFLASAEEIVTAYLGFSPELKQYESVVLSGTGTSQFFLGCRNILSLQAITIEGAALDPSLFSASDDHIHFKEAGLILASGVDNIRISFTAGWPKEEMPSVITLSILRIATLMLSETDGNIGLTGKSFADNSRTFINYSNYRKYLQPLDGLRIVRF